MKVFIYSEDLSEPLDEGIKKAVSYIINGISKKSNVLTVCYRGKKSDKNSIEIIKSNRLLLSRKLRNIIKKFNPDIILYIPRWCGTFASFIRMRILSYYKQKSNSVMVILQPKHLAGFKKLLIKYFFKPDIIFSPSPKVICEMKELGIPVEFFPLFVDKEKFKPIQNKNQKKLLRRKYGLPLEKFIILHVGHLNSGRNLKALVPLQNEYNQVIIVGSSTTQYVSYRDETLKEELENHGIIVMDKYLENIEEIYQLSDVYVFPTVYDGGSIGIPLSVLEARSCRLPIITTDFGGLKSIFGHDEEGFIYSNPDNFIVNINKIKEKVSLIISDDDLDRVNKSFFKSIEKILGE